MAILSKEAIQRLAVLRALLMWKRGAYGPVRVHKVLFFADNANEDEWRLFTFKKYLLGQYSDEVAETLNDLREIGVISSWFDGPSERLRADIPGATKDQISTLFRDYFPKWHSGLASAFNKLAYLSNDAILSRAHGESSYTKNKHGEVIFSSFDSGRVELIDFDDDIAEDLTDLVDVRLHRGLAKRMAIAAERPIRGEDWRKIYFVRS